MKPFILMTGMHRSGTSFLARALNLRGVYLGDYQEFTSDEWRPAIDNLRGHWENQRFLELADETLSISNGSWHKIPQKIRVNSKIKNGIKNLTKNLVENSLLASGLKDPRILLCLNEWKKFFPKKFVIVGIFRNPLKVSESLKIRNGFSYSKSIELWKNYNENLLNYLEKYDGFLIDFDWQEKKLISQIDFICKRLGLSTKIDISQWYTKELLQSDKRYQKKFSLDKDISNLYERLKKKASNNDKVKINFQLEVKGKEMAENFLQEIQNQNNYFKIVINKNLKELSKTKNYQNKLTADLQDKKDEITKGKNFTSTLQKDLNDKENELNESKNYISKLTKELQDKEVELTLGKNFTNKLPKELQDKENELNESRNYVSKLTKDLQDKKDEITKGKNFTSTLRKDLQDKEDELTKGKNFTSTLRKDLQDKEDELTKGKNFVSKLTKEIGDKNHEIRNLENKLNKLKDEISILSTSKVKYYSSRL